MSPLRDAPAIRKRFELRSTRFELGAGAGTTINQDFYHTVLINARLAFHITDWLAIGRLRRLRRRAGRDRLRGQGRRLARPISPMTQRAARADARRAPRPACSRSRASSAAQLELTPFTGKYSLFGKLFSAYDFYVVLPGVAAMNVKPAADRWRARAIRRRPTDPANPNRYVCGVKGTKIGGKVGVGFHSFFGQTVALGVELRDVIAQLNPSGRDVNGDGMADNDDLSLDEHVPADRQPHRLLPQRQDLAVGERPREGTGGRSCRRPRRRSRSTSAPACWTRPSTRRSDRTARSPGSSRPPGGSPAKRSSACPATAGRRGAEPPAPTSVVNKRQNRLAVVAARRLVVDLDVVVERAVHRRARERAVGAGGRR